MLDAAKHPVYEGCRTGHSPLSTTTRMMTTMMNFHLRDDCVITIVDFVKENMTEENLPPGNYHQIQKLEDGIGLPFKMIDLSFNFMIYWKVDASRLEC